MADMSPLHLMRWIEQNQPLFQPPVANKEVFPESEFIYQITRGPNARNDFHIDPGDEIFCQLQGDIVVRYVDGDGRRREAPGPRGRGDALASRTTTLPRLSATPSPSG